MTHASTRHQVMRNAREGVRLASLAGPLGSLLRSIALGVAAGALISRVISLPARPFGWALRRLPSAAAPRVKARPVCFCSSLTISPGTRLAWRSPRLPGVSHPASLETRSRRSCVRQLSGQLTRSHIQAMSLTEARVR